MTLYAQQHHNCPTCTCTKPMRQQAIAPLVSGEQLSAEIIGQYTVDQLLGIQVRFKNAKTGRMENGEINQISSGAARVIDTSHLAVWVPWHEIYCR